MDETGIAVLEDIIDQFLDDPEDDQLVFGLEPFAVVMEAGTGVHTAGAADLLEQVIYGRFEPKILQRWRHQGMADIADKLDGIVDDLLGIVDALELSLFIQVHEILVEVEAGCGEERAGIVVEVGGNALAFLFLEADGSVEQGLLLVLFHALELLLVADYLALVKADEHDQSDRQRQHSDGAKKQHHRNIVIRANCLQ